ncbi:MAG: TlpA family protein disulfide reductase [Candidatus Omnitrophica bacterium]|nr:TlpA family protein disulfide reductase [Candidatus Omnitrophota bacterium]
MKMRLFIKIIAIILMSFIFSIRVEPVSAGAAELSLRDMNGDTVNLSDFKGRVIILDFFATWCPPCKQEIPHFIELQKKYGGGKFIVIGISLSGASATKAFARKFGINYPVLIENGSAAAIYGPARSIPMTLIIDRNFKVVQKYIGYKSKEFFEGVIKPYLED